MADASEALLQVERRSTRNTSWSRWLRAPQRLHYASNRYAVLLIVQAMDVGPRKNSASASSIGSNDSDKHWKFRRADVEERKFWKDYMKAYEACLRANSTTNAPQYVVPADDKENARPIVSQIVVDAFKDLGMAYPKTTALWRAQCQSIRKSLTKQ